MTKLEELNAAIQKAVPELKPPYTFVDSGMGDGSIKAIEEPLIVTLEDVLAALSKIIGGWGEWAVDCEGTFYRACGERGDYENSEVFIENDAVWKLRTPLSKQSPEIVDFLLNLIQPKTQ